MTEGFAVRNELKERGGTVTWLMPGPIDTELFERVALMDTKVRRQKKADRSSVARAGHEAMKMGEGPWRRA